MNLLEVRSHRHGFVQIERANVSHIHEVLFAIEQKSVNILENTLLKISDPNNENYQKWLTFDEIKEIINCELSFKKVISWLTRNSIDITWQAKSMTYVKASANISTWENLFSTEFHVYHDENNLKYHVLAENYSIPIDLSQHISKVFNTCQLPSYIQRYGRVKENEKNHNFKTNLRTSWSDNSPHRTLIDGLLTAPNEGQATISFLNKFYQVESNKGENSLMQSVFQTSDEHFSKSDLLKFQLLFGLPIQHIRQVGNQAIENCALSNKEGNSCMEGNLDTQYIMGMAQNVATIYWYVEGSSMDPFLEWIVDVADQFHPPKSNSISWGSVEQHVAPSVLTQFNIEALKLSLMGVTISVASGDNGAVNFGCVSCNPYNVPNSFNCPCQADSSSSTSWKGNNSWYGIGYFPSFPATSPYVVSVGATMGSKNVLPSSSNENEQACQSQEGGVITSGGGFSTFYPLPQWQSSFVESYFGNLSSSQTPRNGYNRYGRGFPDISFLGVEYPVVIGGQIERIFGTSASAPLFAAFVSLINSLRLSKNLSSIGFINPTLYANAHLFSDIVEGNNNYCSFGGSDHSDALFCASGFQVTEGWDPITGLGTIKFPVLATIFNVSAPYTKKENYYHFVFSNLFKFGFGGLSAETTNILLLMFLILVITFIINTITYWSRLKKMKKNICFCHFCYNKIHNQPQNIEVKPEIVSNKKVVSNKEPDFEKNEESRICNQEKRKKSTVYPESKTQHTY